jgi:hypothetical protein
MPSLRGASDMTQWPPVFRPDGDGAGLAALAIGDGHQVLARVGAHAGDLALREHA